MLMCWRRRKKMWRRLYIVVTVGLIASWWIAHYWKQDSIHVDVGQSLSLHVDANNVLLRLNSPDGITRLRGSLGSRRGTVLLSSVDKSCRDTFCVNLKVLTVSDDEPVLRLQVADAGQSDCYTVKWRPLASATGQHVSVMDCFTLDDALWYGGAQVCDQRWPINAQTSTMQPHITADHLDPYWRANPSYGKYGSLAEPYWLSSAGVGIFASDQLALSSSFNEGGDGRLCLKGDRLMRDETDSGSVPELLSYTVCGGEDVAAVHRTMSSMFLPRPTDYPDVRMMRKPIWSTWAQYKVNVNQSSVEELAERILQYNFPHSQLEIDDRYTSSYGQFDFDTRKFPNASAMIRSLHDRGFRVTSWITPFSNLDCPVTAEGAAKNFWVTDDGFPQGHQVPALTRWWQGVGAVLDVTNSEAVSWFSERLRRFSAEFGIDSFKFDAGEVDFMPPRPRTAVPLNNPNHYSTLYVDMAADFGRMIEVRSAFRNQQLPVFVRMLDKDSVWGYDNGLRSMIPTALQFGIAGYPFVLPDMIGGNAYSGDGWSVLSRTVLPDSELFIRWAELTAFMPSMQFSVVPWQYDDETVAISRKFADLHATSIGDELELAAKDAVLHGWPIIRPLWWLAPTDTDALTCDSEFLLGDRLLVAPILHAGARSRDVYLPGGAVRWKDYFASDPSAADVLSGRTWIRNKPVGLDEIAVFIRVD